MTTRQCSCRNQLLVARSALVLLTHVMSFFVEVMQNNTNVDIFFNWNEEETSTAEYFISIHLPTGGCGKML
jgi:hypothetical protein